MSCLESHCRDDSCVAKEKIRDGRSFLTIQRSRIGHGGGLVVSRVAHD